MTLVRLFRPVGGVELRLIEDSGWRAFPPRLQEQPIFYPVVQEAYAVQIARDWNAKEPEGIGYVTQFEVDADFLAKYPVQQVGSRHHLEYWVPANELSDFNAHIVGPITVIHEFTASSS